MGQYKLAIYLKLQIGFLLMYDKKYNFIEIYLPFIHVMIGLDKSAKGIMIIKIKNYE